MYCNIRHIFFSFLYSHVGFIVVANLLDAHIVLCVDEGLRRGVRLRQGHDAGNVLKVILIVNFNLEKKKCLSKAETTLW